MKRKRTKNDSSNQQKILLTGGAGYVGSVLIRDLLRKGYYIRNFDAFYFGHTPLMRFARRIDSIQGDIRNVPVGILDDVDTIIHLAALSNDPTAEFNSEANFAINTDATVKLAKQAKKKGIKRFIFASSCSVYDLGIENGNGMKTEESFVDPKSAYGLSKRRAEKELLELTDENFCVTILRKGTVYGFSPRMRYDLVINTMIKNAISTGTIRVFCQGKQWRPLIDVEDVAKAYYKALVTPSEAVNGQIFNIALDNFQIKDLAALIQRILNKRMHLNTEIIYEQESKKDRSYRVSNTKAKHILKFDPKNTIEKSVTKLVDVINKGKYADFSNPIYYNITWMEPIFNKELAIAKA